MKFKRFMGLVLAVLMVMSCFTVGSFAATQDVQETKSTEVVYGTPTIDGTLTGTEWDNAVKVDFPYDRNGCTAANLAKPMTYEEGKAPYAMAMWDDDYLYAYFRVYDDAIITTGAVSGQVYNTDSVELYIDELNDKGLTKSECTKFYQITARADGAAQTSTDGAFSADDYKTTINTADGYYEVEMKYAWTDLVPSTGDVIGIDFAINNTNEADGVRDNSLSWNDQTNELYKAPVYAGTATLTGGSDVVKYTVTYDANGGSAAPGKQVKEENVDLTLTEELPIRGGYDFLGWSTTAGGAVEYAAGAKYTANADVTLYAVWEFAIDTESRELPEDATLLTEGWVPNSELEATQIKWQAYTQGDDTVLKFTYWPEETEKVATSMIQVYNATTGNAISWGKGEDLAWGAYETTATKAIIGQGITGINGAAFMTYSKIKTVEITEDLVRIAGSTFEGCSALSSIYYAGSEPVAGEADLTGVKGAIDGYCMDGCRAITSVKLNPNYSGAIGQETFKATAITELNVPAGVTKISTEAFALCESLKKVVINGMDTTIHADAFKSIDGSELKDDNSTAVVIYCYEGSAAEANAKEYGFTYVLLDDAGGEEPETYVVTYDANGGEGAPAIQTKVEDVELTLSSDIPAREYHTFKGWSTTADGAVEYAAGAAYTANADVTLYAVWEYSFDESGNALPEGVEVTAEGWVKDTNLAETSIKWQVYTEGEDQVIKFTLWPAEEGKVSTSVLYAVGTNSEAKSYKKIVAYNQGQDTDWGSYELTATKVIVGNGITAIAGGFVEGFKALEAIEIPVTLTSITKGQTFSACHALSSIYVAGTDPVEGHVDFSNVTSILGNYTFDSSKAIKSVTLSDDLTGSINKETFKSNAITEITIPAGVTSVNAEAFDLCYSLTKVVIKGMDTTIAQYAFADGDGDPDLKGSVTIYCYEGSAAEANAKEYGFTYELLDGESGEDPATYTVTYDANGGEGAPAAQTKTEDVELTLSTEVPTRDGYTFKGWSTTADGAVEYAAGAAYTANADVTLYAVWETAADDENIVTGNVIATYKESVTANNLWSFNRTTKVLTITSNQTGYNESGAQNNEGGWKDILTEIEEVVLVGNINKITGHAFNGATNLKKITLTKGVVQIDGYALAGCSSLETVCIEGSPVIEGVLDFSNITGANVKGSSSFAKADVFSTGTVGTGIILSAKYSDVPSVEGDATSAPALNMANLPSNLETIYGATEYLEAFAVANNLEFVPFGKSTDKNIYWTIEDGVMTLVGEGVLNGLDSAIDAYAADVKKVIIPATITEIADGALAALTALESANFEGNAPVVAEGAKPFGEQTDSFVVNASSRAEGFTGDVWCGYKLNIPSVEMGDVNEDGDINTKDVVALAQFIAEWGVVINEIVADVDGSGTLNTADVVLIAQFVAEWDVSFVEPISYGDIEIESERVV